MAAYVSTKTGNLADATTWTPNGVPSSATGDTVHVVSPHNVTVAASASVGGSPGDQTTAAVTTDFGATLTIDAPLIIKGNFICGGDCEINPGGGIEFDSSGDGLITHSNYVLQTTYGSRLHVNGTSRSNTAYIRSNAAGGNAQLTSVGNLFDLLLNYGDFTRLGSTSAVGLVFQALTTDAGPGNTRVLVNGCHFDFTGGLEFLEVSELFRWEITNNRWTNSYNNTGFMALGDFLCFSVGGDAPTSGTRLFTDNACDLATGFLAPDAWTIERNVLLGNIQGVSAAAQWASFKNNLLYKTSTNETQTSGPCTSNYCLNGAGATQGFLFSSSFGDTLFLGNIFHWLGAGDYAANCVNPTEEGSVSRTITARGNISLPNPSGGSSGAIMAAFNNSSQGFAVTGNAEHNTVAAPAGTAGGTFGLISTVPPERADQCASFHANLLWRLGAAPGTGVYAVSNLLGYTPVVDVLRAADCDYNALTAFDPVPNNAWSSITGDTNVQAGTAYNSPMSGATAPGVHDVQFGAIANAATAGPKFVDPTRNILTFDTHMGGDGTLGHALAALAAQNDSTNPNYVAGYTNAAMIAWVKAGFVPTAATLQPYKSTGDGTQAFPFDATTLDAAGDPMLATIGAMAYLARASGNAPSILLGL